MTEGVGSVTRTAAEDTGIMAFMLPTTPGWWIRPTMPMRRLGGIPKSRGEDAGHRVSTRKEK